MIFDVCGTPDEETISQMTNPYALDFLINLPKKVKFPLKNLISYSNP